LKFQIHFVNIPFVGNRVATISFRNYTVFDDTSKSNVLISPPLDISVDHMFTFIVYFDVLSDSSQLQLYTTSALSHPKTQLYTALGSNATLSNYGISSPSVCIPAGQYQLAFIAFMNQTSYSDSLLSLISASLSTDTCTYLPIIPQYGKTTRSLWFIFVRDFM